MYAYYVNSYGRVGFQDAKEPDKTISSESVQLASARRRDSARRRLILVREMEAADWASLSDEELLERRISKLGLRLEGSALEPLIRQLYDELSAKGLIFHPPCHIGDEWFVPVGIPAIFVPFFLVHDRLRRWRRR